MNVTIYCLKDGLTGEIRYVGKTTQKISRRLSAHLRDKNVCHKTNWIRSLNGKISIEEIEVCSIDTWQEREKFWIKFYKDKGFRLTNQREGGGGVAFHSQFSREKISSKLKGVSRPCTPERAMAISIAKKGKPGKKGIVFSEERKRNISKSLTGLKSPLKGTKRNPEQTAKAIQTRIKNNSFPNSIVIRNKLTGELFLSMAALSRKIGFHINKTKRIIFSNNSIYEVVK